MTKIENHCRDCAADAYPCRGTSCPLRRVEVRYCDKCGFELDPDEIYEVDGDELCEECLKEMFLRKG